MPKKQPQGGNKKAEKNLDNIIDDEEDIKD